VTPWEVEVEDLIMSHGLPAVLRVVLDAVRHEASEEVVALLEQAAEKAGE